MEQPGSWIYRPQSAEVFGSTDGKNYKSLGNTTEFTFTEGPNGVMKISFDAANYRYVKVAVKNNGIIADGKAGAGSKAWLFCDEIEIN